jgi:hypothetical protein
VRDARGLSVETNKGRVAVHPIERWGAIMLHADEYKPNTYTVTHVATGLSIWHERSRREAKAFFDLIKEWPEWSLITNKADSVSLKDRIANARAQASEE